MKGRRWRDPDPVAVAVLRVPLLVPKSDASSRCRCGLARGRLVACLGLRGLYIAGGAVPAAGLAHASVTAWRSQLAAPTTPKPSHLDAGAGEPLLLLGSSLSSRGDRGDRDGRGNRGDRGVCSGRGGTCGTCDVCVVCNDTPGPLIAPPSRQVSSGGGGAVVARAGKGCSATLLGRSAAAGGWCPAC